VAGSRATTRTRPTNGGPTSMSTTSCRRSIWSAPSASSATI